MISISIVEDHKNFREIMVKFLTQQDNFDILGVYASAETAVKGLMKSPPDIAIIDIKLPGISGIDLIKKIKPSLPNTQYLVCSSHQDDETVFQALKNGASGYLLKDSSKDEIQRAILELNNGGAPMSPYIAKKIINLMQSQQSENNDYGLTNREYEVLYLMAKGLQYKELAAKLFISVDTVKNHIKSIYKKMHVQNRIEALNKFKSL